MRLASLGAGFASTDQAYGNNPAPVNKKQSMGWRQTFFGGKGGPVGSRSSATGSVGGSSIEEEDNAPHKDLKKAMAKAAASLKSPIHGIEDARWKSMNKNERRSSVAKEREINGIGSFVDLQGLKRRVNEEEEDEEEDDAEDYADFASKFAGSVGQGGGGEGRVG